MDTITSCMDYRFSQEIKRVLKNLFCDIKNIDLGTSYQLQSESNEYSLYSKYLLRRKYLLFISICLTVASAIFNIISSIDIVNSSSNKLTDSSSIKLQVFITASVIIILTEILLLCLAFSHATDFEKSSKFTLAYFFIVFIISPIFLYIPFDLIIEYSETSGIQPETATVDKYMFYLSLLLNCLPNLLLIQMTIIHSAKIVNVFTVENVHACRQLNYLIMCLTMLYVPILIIFGSAMYMFYYNSIKTILCIIFYIVFLSFQVQYTMGSTQNLNANMQRVLRSNQDFIRNICLIVSLCLLGSILYDKSVNIISLVFTFGIRYIVIGTGLRDIILRSLFYMFPEVNIFRQSHNVQEIQLHLTSDV